MDASSVPAKVRQYPCKGCGANVEFSPGTDALKCPFCGHVDAIPQSKEQIKEYSLKDALVLTRKGKGFGVPGRDVKCERCAAVSHLTGETLSADCAWCGAPLTVPQEVQESDTIAPEAVLPFAVDKNASTKLFRDWVASRWFAPATLKSMASLAKIQGVYRPFWTYDAHTTSHYEGERGDHYYETEHYTETENGRSVQKTRQVRKTRWSHRSGTFDEFFDDVLIPAGGHNDWNSAYQLAALKPYEASYLPGFVAERYTVPVDEGWKRAREEIDGELHRMACRRIGGDEQRSVHVDTAYRGVSFKHILLPLWVASYMYGQKVYRFQVNGQTGEVTGERPYSFWKIFLFMLAIAAVIAGVALLSQR